MRVKKRRRIVKTGNRKVSQASMYTLVSVVELETVDLEITPLVVCI